MGRWRRGGARQNTCREYPTSWRSTSIQRASVDFPCTGIILGSMWKHSAGESKTQKAETERWTLTYQPPDLWAFMKQYPDGATEDRYALLHRDSPGSSTRPKSARRLHPTAVKYHQCVRKHTLYREIFSEMDARIPERNHIYHLTVLI